MEHLTKESFKNKVFDFESNQEWRFAGDKPCIIDFYADWCNPCKVVAPILENLAEEYEGKVDIYKVDTEKEQELASMFNIRSIPSIHFCSQGWKTSDVHGSFAQRKFRPGDQGCSPGSRADRFLNGTRDEFKSVGGSNRVIGETSGFSRTGRIALQPDPLPKQCSEKMCTARRDGMQAFEPFGRKTGSGKDE